MTQTRLQSPKTFFFLKVGSIYFIIKEGWCLNKAIHLIVDALLTTLVYKEAHKKLVTGEVWGHAVWISF